MSEKISPLQRLMFENYEYSYDGSVFRHNVSNTTVEILWNEQGTIAKGFQLKGGEVILFPKPINNQRENW